MNNQIVSNILIRPDAYLIVEAVKSALDKEEESRSNFLDEISEEDRSEFINGEIVKPSPECLRDNRVSALLLRLIGICDEAAARRYRVWQAYDKAYSQCLSPGYLFL